jgi:hypothetical protein
MLVFLLPVVAGIGAFFQKIARVSNCGIGITLISGVFSITLLWTIIAFFFPLNVFVEIITSLLGLVTFFYFKCYLSFSTFFKINGILFFGISLLTIFLGSFFPFILDHFGYYVPTIKWISEVGLVKGISNLDLLLGQMSFWHIFQAGFSHFADPFLRGNVLVLLVYLFYIFEKKSWIHLAFLPFLYLFSQSLSPDLAAMVFSLVILNEVFRSNKNTAFLFALSFFVFAIKPTLIWLPIFVFLYSIFIVKSHFKFMWAGFAIFSVFIFKNIWTFGYPIFPMQLLDLGFSWKPNFQLMQNSAEVAIQKTYDMRYGVEEIKDFSVSEYILNWLFLPGIKGVIHSFFVLSLMAFFLFAVRRNSKLIWLLFSSILVKSSAVLLFSAQYRFFFEVFFVLLFVVFYERSMKKYTVLLFSFLSLFFIGFLSFPNLTQKLVPSFKLGAFMMGFNKNQFYKPSHFKLEKYQTHQIGNLEFNVVQDYVFSFDTPLPAISPQFIQEDLEAGIFPQLKGKTWKEGFFWRKLTEAERQKLESIAKDFEY